MTSHLDSRTTTDVKLDMLSGVQTRNGIPHDRYNIRNNEKEQKIKMNPKMKTQAQN